MRSTKTPSRAARRPLADAIAGKPPPPPPGRQRAPRSDRKPEGKAFRERLMLKLTPAGKRELTRQADRADQPSAASYLRWLLERDRRRLGMPAFAYNERAGLVAIAGDGR